MKAKITLIVLLFSMSFVFSQNNSRAKAEEFLSQKGEVNFSFKINDVSEIENWTNQLSILNYDPRSKTVYAWANTQQFRRFQESGIEYFVEDADNIIGPQLMSNQVVVPPNQRLVSTLVFPLTAYPTYSDYAQQMQDFETTYPSLCQIVDIGGTTEGVGGGNKRLLFAKISANVSTNEQEPRMMYTSSMHGDEIAGYPMMLELINYLLTVYNDTGHPDHLRVKNLLDTTEIWINPSANPDGTYYGDPTNTSVANARRANDNGWDLNRNYPDNIGGAHPDGNSNYELETQHFMALADNYHFVLSANFHGGTEVVNYPWDNTYTRHPDDAWFFLISQEYAENCQNNSPNGYMDAMYTNYVFPGVTNGADWYRVEGGRQDYMNYYQQCKETTIELSNTKTIPASQLNDHWNYNREALLDYLEQGTYGFRGVVRDAATNNPIEAKITLVGHDAVNSHTITELPYGDFYRPTIAGTYDILFEADCYQSFTLANQSISNYQTVTISDILLNPLASTAPSGLNASNVQSDSATVSWDSPSSSNYDCRYRTVGSSNWNTINTNTNSVNLSGLVTATEYEVQVRSNCNSSSSPYSNSIYFTTTNDVTVSASYFETGMDDWVEGGNDCSRTATSYSYEGSYSVRLRDGSGVSSAMTSQTFDLSSYDEVTISFYYYASGMENGKDFWLRYYNGSSWSTLATYTSGVDFSNNSFYSASFTLDASQYNLPANAQFRIQCDAQRKNDQVYIDQVIILGMLSGPDVTPPSVPSNLTASNTTQTSTDLTWNASTDNIGVTGYDVYQNGGFVTNVSGTSYQVTGLTPSTGYSFYVIARDTAGNASSASNSENITTLDPPDTQAPSAPTNLTANNTTSFTTDLSWDVATDNVGVSGYDIYQDGSFIANVSGTTYQVAGLSPSTAYTFYVIARDAAGNASNASNTVNVTTEAFVDTVAPSTPTGLSASNTTETTTDLSWNASTDNIGVDGYDIYQDGIFIDSVWGTFYLATGLSENTTYSFYVVARDAAGNSSSASNSVNETTLAAPTCNDGIQNGDETGVDCGGSYCPICPPSDVILNQGYFETGLDGWVEGGNDCSRVSSSYSYEGSYSMRLRDNSGISSAMTLSNIDTSPFSEIEIDLYFYVNGLNNGESLIFSYFDGSTWVVAANFIVGSGYNNNSFNNATVVISSTQYNFASNAGFRFQSAASKKNEQIYVDQITITGRNESSLKVQQSRGTDTSHFENVKLYPNPVTANILTVKIGEVDAFNYHIRNISGEVLISGNSTGSIDVSLLSSGLYFIELNNGKYLSIKKFIKQ
ncbi:hypothetical protein C1T31_00855 [Hanstruepera neustonica]|uniref:Uncharacterized protein n=1 Tax=Hanstruepera neustonica TaxID=1445657 RepID=A0A2K1E390_9FLAO|nr:M14 family zinc carboxypeptidase [Hanstruepera neustonica]PNQ74723.1 hypothetical protein C1T31_00855 [Hanstruepera neustonica]